MTQPSPLVSTRFSEVVSQGVMSAALLHARAHVPTCNPGGNLQRLSDAVIATGGSVLVGDEPGTAAYGSNATSALIKTQALSASRLAVVDSLDASDLVLDYAYKAQDLKAGDLLIAKDGPVGSVSRFEWSDSTHRPMISSGVVRVRLPGADWFYYSILRFGPFRRYVELLTPSGATYMHAGQSLLLDGLVPRFGISTATEDRVALLGQLAVCAELSINRRYSEIMTEIDRYAGTSGLDVLASSSGAAPISTMKFHGRFDAGAHAALGSGFWTQVQKVGVRSLEDLVSSGEVKRHRGQNLQYTAIGFSEKYDDYSAGYYRLIEPGFIDRNLFVPTWRWLWCPRKLKCIDDGSVVFSAEGSIGNVGILYSPQGIPTVSNIHAIVLNSSDKKERERRNAWLVANIAFFRDKGWLDAISVGGQGGSLALKYHNLVPILSWDNVVSNAVATAIVRTGQCPSAAALGSMLPAALSATLARSSSWSIGDLADLRVNASAAAEAVIRSEYPDLY